MPAPRVCAIPRLQLHTDQIKVVDLAVVSDDVATTRRMHRLVALRRQIDDRQPPMRQRQTVRWVEPDALVIGAAVHQLGRHASGTALQIEASGYAEESCYSAHVSPIALSCQQPKQAICS